MLPPTGGRGVGMAPSLTGRGWGWVGFFAAEAVSRFPGPPLEDPPTSPPRNSTGARGGSAVGRLAHGLPTPTGGAASRPMCQLAWRSGCSAADRTLTSSGGSAADVTPREPQANDWRGGRAAASTSMNSIFSGPAPGMAGDWGGVRDGRAPSGAQRSDLRAGLIAKRASVLRSRTDEEARDPRARERAATCLSRLCRPDRVASGTEARQGRDTGTPAARRAARQPGPAQRGDAQAHRDLNADAPAATPADPS